MGTRVDDEPKVGQSQVKVCELCGAAWPSSGLSQLPLCRATQLSGTGWVFDGTEMDSEDRRWVVLSGSSCQGATTEHIRPYRGSTKPMPLDRGDRASNRRRRSSVLRGTLMIERRSVRFVGYRR